MTAHDTTLRTPRLAAPRLARLMAVGATIAAGLLVAPQLTAQAQQQGERPRREQRMDPARMQERQARMQERQVAFLTQRLELTAEQQTRLRQALEENTKEMKALHERMAPKGDAARRGARPDSATRAAFRAQMQAVRERGEQRVERILTEKQRTAYRSLREERQQRGMRGEHGKGGRDGAKHHGPRGPRGQRGDSARPSGS